MQPRQATGRNQACWLYGLIWLGCLVWSACSKGSQASPIACDQGTLCRDTDCDSICDFDEGDDSLRDTDGDGTPDFKDGDADNDGIRDREEAGDDDPATKPFDRDENGVPDYLDPLYPLHPRRRPLAEDASMMPAATSDAGPMAGSMSEPQAGAAAPVCGAEQVVGGGCTSDEVGGAACDGLDNDCDGVIDDHHACDCARGAVRSCFAGPPERRNVGACSTGTQRCVGGEFPMWGPCEGSIEPVREICDGLDNDCNGCTDELSGCASALSCPAPGDPRIPDASPFVAYSLDATRFYAAPDALEYHWFITGSPCDRLFRRVDPTASEQSGKQSFVLFEPNNAKTEALFTLSGSYGVTLVIDTPSGSLRCDFALRVRAPGMRVELCWDKTGPSAAARGDAVDLDLHLGKTGETSAFLTPNDCYWQTCRGDRTPWDYPNTTQLALCTGFAAQNYAEYVELGFCPNPRLDADNRLDARSRAGYVTENINLDHPRAGDRFRIGVQYNENILSDASDADAGTNDSIVTRAMVNVYCDGALRGSFGGDPENSGDREQLKLSEKGELWRVADILVSDTGCDVLPLSDPSQPGRYWVSAHDSSYGAP